MNVTSRDILIATAIECAGDWDAIYRSLRRRTPCYPVEDIRAIISRLDCKAVTVFDKEYPPQLRPLPRAPFCLFYRGDIALASEYMRMLTAVGSRDPSYYAYEKTGMLCGEMARRGYIVTSGLAIGIDTAVAEATAGIKGAPIAVLGCGIDYIYPSCNHEWKRMIEQNGLVLSEYPGMTSPRPEYFPARNRILAGLSKATFVGEARSRSGTLITVAFALEYGRDVGTLPFRCDDGVASNDLLKHGAAVIETPEDLENLVRVQPLK